MYPRLKLLHKLLAEDEVIFVSIDDNEQAHLRLIMDEIFGRNEFIGTIIWKSRQNKDNRNINRLSNDHEYILAFGGALKGEERNLNSYTNPDNDERGHWASANLVGLLGEKQRPNLHFDLINPTTGINYGRPKMGWRNDSKTLDRLINENLIIWPSSINGRPRRKKFLKELNESTNGFSSVIEEKIFTKDGTIVIQELFGERIFEFPKPPSLVELIIDQVANQDSIILDSFAGSGTTAHAVLKLNKKDGGNRKCLLVEMEDYAESITAERVKRVIKGYGASPILPEQAFPNLPEEAPPNLPEREALTAGRSSDKKPGRWVEETGGSFQFLTLGPRLFHEDGNLNEEVPLEEIRNYVWWSETRMSNTLAANLEGSLAPSPSKRVGEAFLGLHQETAYYLYYEKEHVTTLDEAFLSQIRHKANQYVVYADELMLSQNRLRQLGITFKKIPRDIQLM